MLQNPPPRPKKKVINKGAQPIAIRDFGSRVDSSSALAGMNPSKPFHHNTSQRHQIREVFEGNDRPLAADEVLQLAQKKTAELGMATVYLALAWLLLTTAEGLDTLADDHRHEHKRCQRIRPLPAECKV